MQVPCHRLRTTLYYYDTTLLYTSIILCLQSAAYDYEYYSGVLRVLCCIAVLDLYNAYQLRVS